MNFIKRELHDLYLGLIKPINGASVVVISGYTFLWGMWVVNTFWDVFTRAPLFSELSAVAPEWAWGLVAVIVGLVMLYGVFRPSYGSLTRGAFVGFMFWMTIAVGYFLGDWQNTGGITAAMLCISCAYIYLNVRINREEGIPFMQKGALKRANKRKIRGKV